MEDVNLLPEHRSAVSQGSKATAFLHGEHEYEQVDHVSAYLPLHITGRLLGACQKVGHCCGSLLFFIITCIALRPAQPCEVLVFCTANEQA